MTEPTKEGVAARIEELEARAAALVEYGNSLPDGVTTEAFAEASLLRDEARKLRAAEGVAATKRPSARCGICNYVNNLRADGTLGRHHTWIGGRYAGQCPGTGKTPEETAIERRDWEAIVRGE